MQNPDLRSIRYIVEESLDGHTIEAFLRKKGFSRRITSDLKRIAFAADAAVPLTVIGSAGTVDGGSSFAAADSTEAAADRIPSHGMPEEAKAPGTAAKAAFGSPDPETGLYYGLMVNGRHRFSDYRLQRGDLLDIHLLEEKDSEYVPETNLPLDIVYEDADILVINKPAGLPIHPSKGHFFDSLGNGLAYYAHHTLGKQHYVNRIVNRLDRDTSGLLIAGKNMLASGVLGQAIVDREIHREYLAICKGNPFVSACHTLPGVMLSAALPEEEGASFSPLQSAGPDGLHALSMNEMPEMTISAPIREEPNVAMQRCVDFETGAAAVTHLTLVKYDAARDLSLLRLWLETGRTHQIRVHMLYLGHPLIGDFLYHPDRSLISRQALHSHALRFPHPITGEPLHFRAALPPDMAALFPDKVSTITR